MKTVKDSYLLTSSSKLPSVDLFRNARKDFNAAALQILKESNVITSSALMVICFGFEKKRS